MMGLVIRVRRHPLIGYFAIAFAVSWAVWIPMAVAGGRADQGRPWPSHVPGLLGPIVAAFVMAAIVAGRAGARDLVGRMLRWRVALRWYAAALSPLAFFAVGAAAMAATGRGWPDPGDLGRFTGLPVVAAPVMLILLLLAGFAEETGWRGFAVPAMLKERSLLTTAVIVGLLWALWHVPSFFVVESYREMGLDILPMFTLGIVSGSILLTWMYRGSGGSVLVVALWHGTYNLVSGTAAAQGLVAAIVSTAVMVWATVIVVLEVRGWLRRRHVAAGLRTAAG
jgi:membrane protease YdiL (CAAX protease family)